MTNLVRRRVDHIQFGIINPEKLIAMSVCEVTSDSVMVTESARGSLFDPRMGVLERSHNGHTAVCESCHQETDKCPGHFGHIVLTKPVYHYGFLRYIHQTLRCVCWNCGRLLIDKNSQEYKEIMASVPKKNRLTALSKLARHVCEPFGVPGESPPCGYVQPQIQRKDASITIKKRTKDGDAQQDKHTVTAEKVREVLHKISEEDMIALGFDPQESRPEWMVLTVLPVSPPAVRPSVINGVGPSSPDDLTLQYAKIISVNKELKEKANSTDEIVRKTLNLLQYNVTALFDNEIPNSRQVETKKHRPLKTYRQRLKGKEGRLRSNLMGKRVDFSGRTVISPDPSISIDEVGIPRSVACTLTVPEVVTPWNIEYLKRLVENGPNIYPGATYIIRPDSRYSLGNPGSPRRLEYGYIVERHVKSGDLIVFNRQPSLHKMSMMGHRARVLPYSSFRLNVCVTTPYNADFDGDEMNIHVPQSLTARAEVQELMMVPKNIVTPAANRPVIGAVQDPLLASYIMTSRSSFLEKNVMFNAVMWLQNWNGHLPQPAILKPRPLWTGKQVYSLIIHYPINKEVRGADKDEKLPKDDTLLIQNGQLLTGRVSSKLIGPKTTCGLTHIIWEEHGPEGAKEFLNQMQRVCNYWMLQNGFSCGISDTISDADTNRRIEEKIGDAERAVMEEIAKLESGRLEADPDKTVEQTFEALVNARLNKALDEAGKTALERLSPLNSIKVMSDAGSKGNRMNISQITGCLGQQNVSGMRIPFLFHLRTLPHFNYNDNGPESRGFVRNSYLRGLTPQEFFFHAMGGREGLIDTACKTSETGYIQRKLMKGMEDIQTKYDGTVRNGANNVIEFLYGEDGMDPVRLEPQENDLILLSDAEMRQRFWFDVDNPAFDSEDALSREVKDDMKSNKEVKNLMDEEFEALVQARDRMRSIQQTPDYIHSFVLPGNMMRTIQNVQQEFHIDRNAPTDLHPSQVITTVRKLIDTIEKTIPSLDKEARENAVFYYTCLLRSSLAAKNVICKYRLTTDAFESLVSKIERGFERAIACPGESVGSIAAQSIGEPATQMTLNTFHYAGVSAKNVTLGVPRLKELLDVARHVKTPWLTLHLNPDVENDEDSVQRVQASLEHTTLRSVTQSVSIVFDPDVRTTVIDSDRDMVESYWIGKEPEQFGPLSPWILRLSLNKSIVQQRQLKIMHIANALDKATEGKFVIIANDDNADDLVLHIRKRLSEKEATEREEWMRGANVPVTELPDVVDVTTLKMLVEGSLSMVTLRGFPGLSKVRMQKEKMAFVNPDTNGVMTDDKRREPWVLQSAGTSFSQVLIHPKIDYMTIDCNDITKVYDILGIEAARASLFNEFNKVLSFDGSYTNKRHIMILSDIMTFSGAIQAVNRHGINVQECLGPLSRASFEECVEHLYRAAIYGEKDDMTGISPNIMMGQLAPLGTGTFDVFLDDKMLTKPNNIVYRPQLSAPPPGQDNLSPDHDRNYTYTPYSSSPTSEGGSMFSPNVNSPRDGDNYSPSGSTAYSPSSPAYSPSSPAYSPSSPAYSPSSPAYSPSSPAYSPSSPAYSPSSPAYSPSSPAYSPSSPAYSPSSPAYSPSSPAYSPSSPAYSPSSPAYSPSSPAYSPSSPAYSPTSPAYSPSSPAYSPSSPAYSPSSPAYSPSSPAYNGPSYGNKNPPSNDKQNKKK